MFCTRAINCVPYKTYFLGAGATLGSVKVGGSAREPTLS